MSLHKTWGEIRRPRKCHGQGVQYIGPLPLQLTRRCIAGFLFTGGQSTVKSNEKYALVNTYTSKVVAYHHYQASRTVQHSRFAYTSLTTTHK